MNTTPCRERGTKETQLAEVLSPVSRKRTGRAYVALARAHSEKFVLHFEPVSFWKFLTSSAGETWK
jgi:hypothetical protein